MNPKPLDTPVSVLSLNNEATYRITLTEPEATILFLSLLSRHDNPKNLMLLNIAARARGDWVAEAIDDCINKEFKTLEPKRQGAKLSQILVYRLLQALCLNGAMTKEKLDAIPAFLDVVKMYQQDHEEEEGK